MLFCKNIDTNQRLLADKENSIELRNASNKGFLMCSRPGCSSKMIYKNGPNRIAHFAHKNVCTYLYHEPESEIHLKGKMLLGGMLTRLFPTSIVEIESWIKETSQEADVLITHPDGSRWAFEFQCSKIPGSLWKERHNLYSSANIKDFWILNNVLNKKSKAKDVTDNPHWLMCDLGATIFCHQFKLSYLKSFVGETDTNYVIFLDTETAFLNILYGGFFEGKSLFFSEEDNVSIDKIKIIDDEFYFPKFDNYLGEIKDREEYRIKEEIETAERIRIKEEETEKRRKLEKEKIDNYCKRWTQKISIFEIERSKEEKMNINQILEVDIRKFEDCNDVKIFKTFKCPICEREKRIHGQFVLRTSTRGPFFGCTNFPYCKHTDSPTSVFKLKAPFVKCRKCGNNMYLSKGNNGQFSWDCSFCKRIIKVYLNVNYYEDLERIEKGLLADNKKQSIISV